jgi:tetratricopeptide (TPR) repeat protein
VGVVLVGLAVAALIAARPYLRAGYHLRRARSELQRYHNPQAIRHLHICRQTWPRDPEVLLLAARAARRARVYADTERLLRMYHEARGRDEAFTFEEMLLAAETRLEQVADRCWSQVEAGHADAPLILEALTRGYLRQYRLGQARLCLDRWLRMQPDAPQALYLEGLLNLDYIHSHAAALTSYRRAVELDPEHEEARLGLAVALLSEKLFAEAAEHFERLRQAQPDNLSVRVGLAECLDGLGQPDPAERQVDEVLAHQPSFAPALSLRGQFALKRGQPDEAEAWLRQALRRKPMDHRARYSLSLCLQQNGKEEEARQEQRRLLQMEEDLKRFNEIVTREIAQRPTDPALHLTLGQILLRSGQEEEGVRWLQNSLRLDPAYVPARQALADYLSRKNAPGPRADSERDELSKSQD